LLYLSSSRNLTSTVYFISDGTIVCITGASSGIGKELAKQYARRNAKLILAARSRESLIQAGNECQALGCNNVEICPTDVTKPEDCKRLIDFVISKFGSLDLLVLSAGISAYTLFENIQDISIFDQLMQTNFYGYLYCTYYALPYLKRAKGQVLVISSVSGEIGLPFRTAYCASKFAITGFFEALRSELDKYEVAITIVCPPSVKTNLRNNSIIKIEGAEDNEHRMEVVDCVAKILEASDRRARKIFFPFKLYFAAYLRPFLPDIVDRRLKRAAKL
jgi:short-subunit dehydrogenase